MFARFLAVLALVLLAPACKKAGGVAPPIATPSTPAAVTAPKAPEVNGAPLPQPTTPPGTACFSSCMRQLEMRAVGIDVNRRDCRERCERDCVAPCVQRSQMRSVSKEQIQSDCQRSCGL